MFGVCCRLLKNARFATKEQTARGEIENKKHHIDSSRFSILVRKHKAGFQPKNRKLVRGKNLKIQSGVFRKQTRDRIAVQVHLSKITPSSETMHRNKSAIN